MSDEPKSDPSTKHLGSDFDDFLADEGLLDEAEAVAMNRVLVFSDRGSDARVQTLEVDDGAPHEDQSFGLGSAAGS